MAENRGDAKLAARYRALATEEPSAVLDDAIRAAARRAVSSAPDRRASNWTIPASIAAVLVLSFGITLRMLEEQPGVESSAPAAPAPEAMKSLDTAQKLETPKPVEAPREVPAEVKEKKRIVPPPVAPARVPAAEPAPGAVPAPAKAPPLARTPEAFRDARPAPAAPPAAAPAFAPPPAAAPAAAAPAPAVPVPQANLSAGRRDEALGGLTAKRAKAEEAESRVLERAAQAPAGAAAETPERQLEKIAELRLAGRDREADEALAKFRKEHPDFVIKPGVWERVKPR